MNELEVKLKLIELSPEERMKQNPQYSSWLLKQIPKAVQTYEVCKLACQNDGVALEYVSKKLITEELCKIAVESNGMALQYIPEEYITEEMCFSAVAKCGKALQYVPSVVLRGIDRKKLVKMIMVAYENDAVGAFEYSINKVTNHNTPHELWAWVKDSLSQAVKKSPECLKDIMNCSIMTNKEIRCDVLDDLVPLALSISAKPMPFVPSQYISREMCEKHFEKDCTSITYFPEEYITEEMCITVTRERRLFVAAPPSDWRRENLGDEHAEVVLFEDLPEDMRNNKAVLQEIVKNYRYGSLPLLNWNERIITRAFWETRNKKGKLIIPLRKETIEYLKPLAVTPPESKPQAKYLTAEIICVDNKECRLQIPLQNNIPESYSVAPHSKGELATYDFSESSTSSNTFYYISDIHVEHQLQKELASVADKSLTEQETILLGAIEQKIDDMISNVSGRDDILLIGGDVADSVGMSELFYQALFQKWNGGTIISVLGNHELWDGTIPEQWNNPDFCSRSVDLIIEDYRKAIRRGWCGEREVRTTWGLPNECYVSSKLLENELYIRYKNHRSAIISENDILSASKEDLADVLHKCTLIILGGIGFSGLNPEWNATKGLYRKALSIEEDKQRTAKFQAVYEKVCLCASDKTVIVLTHTPPDDWTDKPLVPDWIYVNGHTHQNLIRTSEEGAKVLSDNQIGYKPHKWNLNSFLLDMARYDPFEKYEDGIYKINSEQYKDFNRGREIASNGCNYEGTLYMLKRNKIYMFVLQTSKTLCLLAGGQRKRLSVNDPQYYYDNMTRYAEAVNKAIEPYKEALKKISAEVEQIGGTGKIHGCIVDISFFSHIYLNPFDGKITPYWAWDTSSREFYESTQKLIEDEEPELLDKYLIASKKSAIPLIGNLAPQSSDTALATVPQWAFGTEMYKPSRIMKAVQYIWEQNVIRIWNDDVLRNTEEKESNLLTG